MLDIALHAAIALLAFIAALFVEHFRVPILSRSLFWKRRTDLIGTYATAWTRTHPPHSSAPTAAEDLVRIQWASGSYVSGTASNASFGDYAFQGRTFGNAMNLTYRSKEARLYAHLGAIMLKIESDGTMHGNWLQNKPDESVVFVGTTAWKKRPT